MGNLEKFKHFRYYRGSSTHYPFLMKAIENSDGPVMEIGSGFFSTPLIHWMCFDSGRKVVTYENQDGYIDFAKKFVTKDHQVVMLSSWDDIDAETHWSVVLVDHNNRYWRANEVAKLKDKADYIILHDSEDEKKYGYDKIWKHFKYRADWTKQKPHTTVLSNFKDLSDFNG